MPQLLWLPPRRHLGALVEQVPALRRVLSKATRLPDAAAGVNSLLATAFPDMAATFATAALTRRIDAPEDHDGRWLRVDPCHLRVEIAGVRMLACAGMQLAEDELSAFETALRPFREKNHSWLLEGRPAPAIWHEHCKRGRSCPPTLWPLRPVTRPHGCSTGSVLHCVRAA